ncbi:hypothetical protein M3G54_12095, partial [Brevibacterium casei]|uniref:hypothetical protein n=2 Tax=Brevibacteriaceae TaxID=85019 RepID=UPI00223B5CFF
IICTLFLVYLRVSSWSNWLRGRNANRGLYILLRILEALSVGMAVAVTGALSASSGSSISLPDLITVGVLVVIVFVAIEKFVYSSSRLGEAIKVRQEKIVNRRLISIDNWLDVNERWLKPASP